MTMRMAFGILAWVAVSVAGAQSIALLGLSSKSQVAPRVAAGQPLQRGQIGVCGGDPGGADLSAQAAGKAGIPVIQDAFLVMKARNHTRPGKSLEPRAKEALRPVFGGVVDRVKVVWNARLLDEWRILGKTLQFGQDTTGQTFGNAIYISHAEPVGDWSRSRLKLVIHEMTHALQADSAGGLRAFADDYIRGWWQASRSYQNNWMERQARRVADAEIGAAYARYEASALPVDR